MKKLAFVLIGLMVLCGSALAVTREGSKVPTTITLEGGYESIGNLSKTVTTAGTPVQLSSTSIPVAKCIVCASADNTGVIAVGGASVSARGSGRSGITLGASDCVTLSVDNLSSVYVDSSVSAAGVSQDSVNVTYQEYI